MTLTQQFKLFYLSHKPKNFEDAILKFAIFGGVEWGKVDTSRDSFALIKELILNDYRFIRNDITELTSGAPLYHAVLSGIAMGDGKTHSCYKRANVTKDVGDTIVEELSKRAIIRVEKAKNVFTSWSEAESVDNRLHFTTPFIRFWFAFISPLFKGIRDGEYKEVQTRFANRESEFVHRTFIELAHEFLKLNFKDDKIVTIGSYWDRDIMLDIYAKTESGKTIVGSCKFTNTKVKKSEYSHLVKSCEQAKIEADIFVIFSKKGYSSELKRVKSENIKLFTIKNFITLVEEQK